MSKKRKKRKTGLPPGTLFYTGNVEVENPDVTVLQFNESTITEQLLKNLDCPPPHDQFVTWYDVRGLNNLELVERVGRAFQIHPLALEDVVNIDQRPKWEDYQNSIFLIVKALKYDDISRQVITEQVAFLLGERFVLTFQEDAEDLFHAIRLRLHEKQGRVRQRGADYLMYALIDNIVDEYFLILDKIEDTIDAIEIKILNHYTPSVRNDIYQLKRQLTEIRRAVMPMRDVIGRFMREEGRFVDATTNVFTRDLYDHVLHVIELVESQRDMITNLHELYNSEQTNRANHVMKVLTIVSAIFIPLTFIVGVYGTNFDILPELHHPQGYFVMWVVMVAIAILQLLYFKQKKWL